jgi:DNA modification methylase
MKINIQVTRRLVESLIPYARNARTHSDAQVAQIAASIKEFGFNNPVLVDGENGIIAGHGRVLAARKLGLAEVPVIELSHLSETQKRAFILADNKLALNAGWDQELLSLELGELKADGFDLDLTGFDGDELNEIAAGGGGASETQSEASITLSDRFGVVPFSVLDARRGWWQERKKNWIASGIKSGIGRGSNMLNFSAACNNGGYAKELNTEGNISALSGTSIFDPVLCELAYLWFSPPGGLILDPFAGGSVRGWVAAKTGRQYVGCDLRPEQVEANRNQWNASNPDDEINPVWLCGDSRNIDRLAQGVEADMIFSCPPYADLEKYSDDPLDLSNIGYAEFIDAYREIVRKSIAMLKQDRFACFVVGDVRDEKGIYRNFVGDTVQAFTDAGASYYNEAILITMIGSLPIRVGKQFTATRKLGKTHQNVLVFVKGDPKKSTEACGKVEIDDALFEAEAGD